jgi:hypothetical protein
MHPSTQLNSSQLSSSITRGDYLTLFSGIGDDESMTDISATLSMSPQYGKKDDCFTFREMCK